MHTTDFINIGHTIELRNLPIEEHHSANNNTTGNDESLPPPYFSNYSMPE
jgi:hypothetical protein